LISDLSGNLQSEYVFFDGARVARRDNPSSSGPVFYYFSDHLKTTDIVTDAQGNIKNESDFYPWGGELQFLANDSNHYKFTGKERDAESQLDYFGARYYSNGLGKFLTTDPKNVALRHLLNPQKLNKYSYTINNPTSFLDPNGMEEVTIQLRAFIPPASVAGFRGDNRSFSPDKNASSRTSVTVRIETDRAKNHGNPMIGKPQIQISPTHLNLTGSEKTSTGPKTPEVKVTQDNNGNVTVNVQENMRNPFTPVGGGIQENVNITVNQNATSAEFKGQISGSPAFEGNVTVGGGQTQNVPLQDAPTNSISFGLGLQKTNDIDKKVDLPQPQPENKENK
jgi:RHS repeat-associated protein